LSRYDSGMENKNWCEIFRTGKHVDKKGRERNWTEGDLDHMVASYDPAGGHEAPIVIDHDEEGKGKHVPGGPAYGWIDGLKRVGSNLYAAFKSVVPEFAKAVNDGFFKKRSIRILPDGTLGHVAFLGALPPAIKGMPDHTFTAAELRTEFSSRESDCFEYSQAIDDFKFQEADHVELEKLKKKNEDLEAENKRLAEENKRVSAEFSEGQRRQKRQEIDRFIETGIAGGTILPAWKKAGLAEFMAELEDQDQTYEFSEGKKQTASAWFRDFLAGFASHPLFKTMAKPEAAKSQDFSEDAKAVDMIVNAGSAGKKEGK